MLRYYITLRLPHTLIVYVAALLIFGSFFSFDGLVTRRLFYFAYACFTFFACFERHFFHAVFLLFRCGFFDVCRLSLFALYATLR